MVSAVLRATARMVLRLRCAVVLMSVLVAAWLLMGLRLYFLPPVSPVTPSVFALLALGAGVNAVILGFFATWVWRGARWATWAAALTLLVDALLVIQPAMAAGERLLLTLTLAAGVLVASLLVSPQRPPQY